MNASLRQILLATDGSQEAALALRAAADLSEKTGADLHVVHVWTALSTPAYHGLAFDDYYRLAEEKAKESLRHQAEKARVAGGNVAGEYLRAGGPAEEIAVLAQELDVDLVAVGSRGVGPAKRLISGSVSEGVVHRASRPALVMRGGEGAWPPTRIIIGDDASRPAKRAGELAAEIANLCGAEVVLVRAYEGPTEPVGGWGAQDRIDLDAARLREERALEERARWLEAITQGRIKTLLAASGAVRALLSVAEKRDEETTLFSVGSRGLGAAKRALLGSISTKILRAADGVILIVPPEAAPAERLRDSAQEQRTRNPT